MSKQADDTTLSKATEQLIETLPAQNAVQAEKQPEPQTAAPAGETADDREYREALAAVKAEQNPPKKEEVPAKEEPPAKIEPVKEPEQKVEQPAQAEKKAVMIPKERFDEVRVERDEAKNIANYYKGIVDANKDNRAKQSEKPAEPVKTIDELLTEIDTQQIALAKQYDEGQLTAVDWTTKRNALDRQAATIRTETLRIEQERIRREALATARKEAMELSLEDHAVRMDAAHPGIGLMPENPNHPMWALLQEKAEESLSAEGVKLIQGDARSTMIFRQRMAELADKYAPLWTEKSLPGKTNTPPVPQQQQPSVTKPSMADQRFKKIEVAHQQPPDTGKLGSSGTKPELSDAQISKMSDDDLAVLPASTLARMKGIAA